MKNTNKKITITTVLPVFAAIVLLATVGVFVYDIFVLKRTPSNTDVFLLCSNTACLSSVIALCEDEKKKKAAKEKAAKEAKEA